MTVETFKLPDVGEGVAEGELVRWLVEVGDDVAEDQLLAEVETDKAVVDLPSPYEGTVRELHAAEGEMVPVGNALVSIEVGNGEEPRSAGSRPEAGDGEAVADASAAGSAGTGGEAAAKAAETAPEPTAGRVFAPPSTRRLARELGVDLRRIAGSVSGRITDADVRAAADGRTEDADAEAPDADAEGEADADAEPPSADAEATSTAREREAGTHRESAAAVEQATEAAGAVREEPIRERTLAAPATRRLAAELGVDLDAVPTDETRDGVPFVTPAMVREYAERRAGEAEAGAPATPESAPTDAPAEGPAPGDRIPYRGIRRSIGEQMERSKYTAPHATHTDEVDVTALVETRADLAEYADERGVTLTYLPFVLRAVTRALAAFPQVNASLDAEAGEIVCHDDYNVGVATATDAGLLVPVIEDVDEKGLLELAAETAAKVERARDRSIAREEMQGGTFTVTNIGVIGGEYATPIVNYPEVAILALGRIAERPRVVDGEVVPRYTLPLSLSVDHRVVDGAVAARFTNRVMDLLASPARLLIE